MLAQGIKKVATWSIPPEIDKLATLSIPGEIDKVATSSMPKDVTVLKVPRTRTLVYNLIASVVEHAHAQGR